MSVFFAVPFSIISQFSSVLRLLIATVQKLGRTSAAPTHLTYLTELLAIVMVFLISIFCSLLDNPELASGKLNTYGYCSSFSKGRHRENDNLNHACRRNST